MINRHFTLTSPLHGMLTKTYHIQFIICYSKTLCALMHMAQGYIRIRPRIKLPQLISTMLTISLNSLKILHLAEEGQMFNRSTSVV